MSWAQFTQKHVVITGEGGNIAITPNKNRTLMIQLGTHTSVVASRDLVEAVIAMSEESGWYLDYLKDELS